MSENASEPANESVEKVKQIARSICGIVIPISDVANYRPGHWQDVHRILEQAISEAGWTPQIVSRADEASIIHRNIVTNLLQNEIVVCDVSSKNPNVMLELGLRLAIGKPVVVVKDDKTDYTFDAGLIEHIGYPADLRYEDVVSFKSRLATKLKATKSSKHPSFLETFGPVQIPELPAQQVPAFDLIIKKLDELALRERAVTNNPARGFRTTHTFDAWTDLNSDDIADVLRFIQATVGDRHPFKVTVEQKTDKGLSRFFIEGVLSDAEAAAIRRKVDTTPF